MAIMCQDWPDRPGCLGERDPQYTMHFDDLGEPPIYWCSHCGRWAHEVDVTIEMAVEDRGKEFLQEFSAAIDKAKGH